MDSQLLERLKEIGMSDEKLEKLTNQNEPDWEMVDEDTLRVGDKTLTKPFVENPLTEKIITCTFTTQKLLAVVDEDCFVKLETSRLSLMPT